MIGFTQFILRIELTPVQIAMLAAVLLISIYKARPEWILGVYLSMSLWARVIVVGSIAHTWVLLAALFLATVHYVHQERRFAFTPEYLRERTLGMMPRQDRWVIVWMLLWWGWMLLLLNQFDADEKIAVLRPILLNVIIPMPVILLLARDLARLRGFAMAYVLAAVVGCWLALDVYKIPLSYLLTDPALEGTGLVRLGLRNYHFFSHFCAIGFILATTLYLDSKSLLKQGLMLLCAAWCAYFLLLAGARQSMSGAIVCSVLILLWMIARGGPVRSVRALLLASVVTAMVIWLYQESPQLIIREDEAGNVANSFNIFDGRGKLWAIGWGHFLTSPLWGLGFEQTVWSHNLFVGTLSDQGVIGMIFFVGFLVFVLRRMPAVWMRAEHDPRDLWRVAFFAIFLFGMIHGMASGNTSSTAHLYWSAAALWWLGQDVPRPAPRQVVQGSVAGQPLLRVSASAEGQ